MAGLQGPDGAALLNTVDMLRGLSGVGHELSLPQIIVVGSQSMGKSSVLEAISGFKFPVGEVLSTQFVTEVVLRRSAVSRYNVSIIPHAASQDQQKTIASFDERWQSLNSEEEKSKRIQQKELEEFIEEAKGAMNLTPDSFSKDKLKLELSDPEQDHLTLVDLPGLISSNASTERDQDIDLVSSLVESYMSNPNAIILAIVSARTNWQTQPILRTVKKIDPYGRRTLGVITSPDKLQEDQNSEQEKQFKDLMNNKKVQLDLGWHVLRNPDQVQRKKDGFDRDQIEREFFELGFWSDVPADFKGAVNLRKRLADLLRDHISRELPKITSEVDATIRRCQEDLKGLGEERHTSDHYRSYLERIANDFTRLTERALHGEYRGRFFDNGLHSLRSQIRRANRDFAHAMFEYGHTWTIIPNNGLPPPLPANKPPAYLECSNPTYESKKSLCERVSRMYDGQQGLELDGMQQPVLVGKLFKLQRENWHKIAKNHVDYVFHAVEKFVRALLRHVAGDSQEIIFLEVIYLALEERRTVLNEKFEEIIRPYLDSHPQTINERFDHFLYSRGDADCSKTGTSANSLNDHTNPPGERSNVGVDNRRTLILKANEPIVDFMEAYYGIALGVFVDNVAILVIEQCLLENLPELFTTAMVTVMDEQTLASLAREPPERIGQRQNLRRRLEVYKEARKMILKHSNHFVQPLEPNTSCPDSPSSAADSGTFSRASTAVPSFVVAPDSPKSANQFRHPHSRHHSDQTDIHQHEGRYPSSPEPQYISVTRRSNKSTPNLSRTDLSYREPSPVISPTSSSSESEAEDTHRWGSRRPIRPMSLSPGRRTGSNTTTGLRFGSR